MQIKVVSSLQKVFLDKEPEEDLSQHTLSSLQGGTISFQLAICAAGEEPFDVWIKGEGLDKKYIRFRSVEMAPSYYPIKQQRDLNYLKDSPGIYPDILRKLEGNRIHVIPGQWHAIWVEIDTKLQTPNTYQLKLSFYKEEQKQLEQILVNYIVRQGRLLEQKIVHTEWFYTDCLADYYNVKVWSKEHWDIIDHYMKCYQENGCNMILTPIITPPLDVKEGTRRTVTQLAKIKLVNNKYIFDFSRLAKWIKLCKKNNITYLEIAHLYSQWGAKKAPYIEAEVDGQQRQIFGDDIDAISGEYRRFLKGFLRQLINFLQQKGIYKNTYFHISDEPEEKDLKQYALAKEQVKPYIGECKIIDAISNISFYNKGYVEQPVPSVSSIEAFLNKGISHLWTYYCNAQSVNFSNRFFSMPLQRTRILGVQLYKFKIEGFLHWGFNFYNTRFSVKHINPYINTDAGGNFPSGDSFIVYPGPEGKPEESIRLKAMKQAMEDVRALETLEALTSSTYVMSLIQQGLEYEITFEKYPQDANYLLELRERVEIEIEKRQEKER